MKKYISKNVIYYLLTLLLIIGYGSFKFVIPQISMIIDKKNKIADTDNNISVCKASLKPVAPKLTQDSAKNLSVTIFTSPYPGLDVENASVDLVDQFIETLKTTQNKIIEISFNVKPADPASPVNILTLNMTLNSTYVTFQNLLQKIYTWKYLAAIKDIIIEPVQGDPNNLNIKFTIDLYINK